MSSTQASASASSETYTGSCHCQHFKYTVTHSPPFSDPSCEVTECNCSICSRNGYLLIYVKDSDIVFESGGEDDFKKYTFTPKKHGAEHYFCPHCGTSCFIKPPANFFAGMKAVNVRTFAGVDLKGLTLKFADGKSI